MKYSDKMPNLLTDIELINNLKNHIETSDINSLNKIDRLNRLLDIYDIFIPNKMSIDIYYLLYSFLMRSLQKKEILISNNQMIINRRIINGTYKPKGINGGDCSLIVGDSGIGKTSSFQRAIEIIAPNNYYIAEYNQTIIPFLVIEASPISSAKSCFFEILRMIDECIGTNYYESNNRSTINTDSLLGVVCEALLLHVGVLIIDEADRLVGNKKSITLINFITELMNLSGVSIIMFGTKQVLNFFEQTPYLARRSMGQVYSSMEYEKEYIDFLIELFKYQFTLNKIELTSKIARHIYNLTSGVQALIIQLFILTQQEAIKNNTEIISIDGLTNAFKNKMNIVSGFLKEVSENKLKSLSESQNQFENVLDSNDSYLPCLFIKVQNKSNKSVKIAIQELKRHIDVVEISI